jgi:hypothetical protein
MAQRCPKFHVQPTTKRFRTMMRGSARQAYMMPSFQYRSLRLLPGSTWASWRNDLARRARAHHERIALTLVSWSIVFGATGTCRHPLN